MSLSALLIRYLRGPVVLGGLLAMFGCVSVPTRPDGPDFDTSFASGQYHLAVDEALRRGRFDPQGVVSRDLLWSLNAGSAMAASGRVGQSIEVFDQTEAQFRIYDEESAFQKLVLNNIGATLVNDKVLAYRGQLYDATMVNAYKALGFMQLGQWDNARVELNRAMDRQRRAADFFADEIAAQREALAQRQRQQSKVRLNDGLSAVNGRLAAVYSSMEAWEAYPDFVNPLVSYLQGVFLLSRASDSSDLQKAADAFKEAAGMNPGNPALLADLQLADALAAGRQRLTEQPPMVWVLIENGLGPIKESRRIDIPAVLFAPNGNVAYVGLAYPVLQQRNAAHREFSIYAEDTLLGRTTTVADIDRLVQSEFRRRFPGIITRAVVSAAVKTAFQAELAQRQGSLGMLIGAIYQAATTQADTRIWSALPKEFQALRIQRPASGRITLRADDGSSIEVALPAARFSVVHLRAPRPGTPLQVQAFALHDRSERSTVALDAPQPVTLSAND